MDLRSRALQPSPPGPRHSHRSMRFFKPLDDVQPERINLCRRARGNPIDRTFHAAVHRNVFREGISALRRFNSITKLENTILITCIIDRPTDLIRPVRPLTHALGHD